MGINFKNFLSSQQNNSKMGDYQNLDHVDGVAISSISANLYNNSREEKPIGVVGIGVPKANNLQ